MNIFYKRPLSLILCVMLGGFVISSRTDSNVRAFLIILSALLIGTFSLLRFVLKRKTGLPTIAALGLLISVLFSQLYFGTWFNFTEQYADQEIEVCGKVTKIDSSQSSYTVITVNMHSVNGEKQKRNRSIILKISGEDNMFVFRGALVSFKAKVLSIEDKADFDAVAYYYSKGIFANADEYRDFRVLGKAEWEISDELAEIKENISKQSMLSMGAEAGGLFSALFMGEKSYLSPRLGLDFKRIGISHILALSGMHLAILSLGLTRLLSFIGVSKKPRTVIIIAFTLSYMALTGFSVSVVRAGIMLIISSLLFLLSSMKDMPTNLALSVFLIVILTPYAVFDVALWLSAFATLGILIINELIEKKQSNSRIIIRFSLWILASVTSSFFAISLTMAIMATVSETASLLAIFSTLIFSLLTEIFIYLGIIMLPIGALSAAGATIMRPIYVLIDSGAHLFSSQKWAIISTNEPLIKMMIGVFTVLFFAFIVLKTKWKRSAIIALAVSFVTVHCTAAAITHKAVYSDDVIYTNFETHDIFTLKSNGECSVIDIGGYSKFTAYDTVDTLASQSIFTLDTYIVSHYSFALPTVTDVIFSNVKVDTLLIPSPKNDDEAAIYELITAKAEQWKTKLRTYELNETVSVSGYAFSQIYRAKYGEETAKCAFRIGADDKIITYLGSGMLETATCQIALEALSDSNTVIFGAHGTVYSPKYHFYHLYEAVSRIIFAGKKITLSEESVGYYKEKGTEIIYDPGTVRLIH